MSTSMIAREGGINLPVNDATIKMQVDVGMIGPMATIEDGAIDLVRHEMHMDVTTAATGIRPTSVHRLNE